MKVIIPCHCSNRVDFEYDEDVFIDDSVKKSILTGNFMTVECGKCGITLKPEFPVMFRYGEKPEKIFFVPELHRDSFLTGNSSYQFKTVDRFVVGFMELAEKILIFDSGLDDVAVEGVKYYIISKIIDESNEEKEVYVYFERFDEDSLIFQIHGLKDNEIGMIKINIDYYMNVADSIEQNIESEPFSLFLVPPYVSVMKIYRDYSEKRLPPGIIPDNQGNSAQENPGEEGQ